MCKFGQQGDREWSDFTNFPVSSPSPLAGEGCVGLASAASLAEAGWGVAAAPMPNHYARQLRRNMTDAERVLWRLLRQRQVLGLRFRRQVPIDHYIADFACLEMKLVIEADGGQHSESETDKVRDAHLPSQGFYVLRFWNSDILTNSDGVYRIITETVERLNNAARARPA